MKTQEIAPSYDHHQISQKSTGIRYHWMWNDGQDKVLVKTPIFLTEERKESLRIDEEASTLINAKLSRATENIDAFDILREIGV